MRLALAVCATTALAALIAACSNSSYDGGRTAVPTPPATLPAAVTTTGAGETATLDGERFVVVRTLPAATLSADQLEPAGEAQSSNDERIAMAKTSASDVADWELVSPAEDGWRVWQPDVVRHVVDGASSDARIISVEAVDWPDACLGAANPGDICAAVITPGYRIILDVGGQRVEYHTDRHGAGRRVP
jgi:hypothetical protein